MLPYSESGRGATVLVFLHFFGGSRRQWIDVAEILEKHYRCITVDLPGFGDASHLPGYSVAEMRDQVCELIERLDLRNVIVVGHSMSGKVALAMAQQRAASLLGLVLVAPSPPSPEPIPGKNREQMLAMSRTPKDGERYIDDNSALPLSGVVRERAVEDFTRCFEDAWRSWLEHGSREDWSARIGSVALPALVIAGGKDQSLGPEVQKKLTLPHLENVRMTVLKDSGHLLPMEFPSDVAEQIDEFVRTNASRHSDL